MTLKQDIEAAVDKVALKALYVAQIKPVLDLIDDLSVKLQDLSVLGTDISNLNISINAVEGHETLEDDLFRKWGELNEAELLL
jgi:hypothetical protein